MKCLVLAGGHGERLWPLSRKDYPKQFIQIQKNHSMFQETIARNIPYCDEFIIVTNQKYRFVVENQMEAFRGTPYRCIYEETPVEPIGAILLACMGLRLSEFVFVVPADTVMDSEAQSDGDEMGYKESILVAKAFARQGRIVGFGGKDSGRNLSMLLFQNGTFQKEVANLLPEFWDQCYRARKRRERRKRHMFYSKDALAGIETEPMESGFLNRTRRLHIVPVSFRWSMISSLEDLARVKYNVAGVNVVTGCDNTMVINNAPRLAVVVNGIDDAVVINTPDAVYVGSRGAGESLREIIKNNPALKPYVDKGVMQYRSWGYSEQLVQTKDYRIRQVTVLPGKTVLAHIHSQRMENWTIVAGVAQITLDDVSAEYGVASTVMIPCGVAHQVTNIGDEPLVFVETAIGEILPDEDVIAPWGQLPVVNNVDPMIKLTPAFKDSLWGGTKLRDIYGMNCDYDVIAESWQMSAHPAGQSIVASGRHKGMTFGDYLEAVGKDILGWKCEPLRSFPMLIKFIDARENLSVQVHPDDEYALEQENQYGKNEMWYVVDSDPGSGLYVGFNRDVTREEVQRRIEDNSIMELMNFYPTKPGDVFFIPAGTVHAIGAGNLICEIQQSSNCTYRLYDYGRVDKFGNPRELHLEKALDVLSYEQYTPESHSTSSETEELLAQCKYFETIAYHVNGEQKIPLESSTFHNVVCIRGSGELTLGEYSLSIKAGESVFIPATDATLIVNGQLSFVLSHI